jgi:S-adenosylmethionine/arginine decarboxylase-like enzyme
VEEKHIDFFLLLVGKSLDINLLEDEELLSEILRLLPIEINMKPIREPIISGAIGNPGLEGYVPIDTSNITISTYTETKRLVVCIHSCKEFDYMKVISIFRKKYQLQDLHFLKLDESKFQKIKDTAPFEL